MGCSEQKGDTCVAALSLLGGERVRCAQSWEETPRGDVHTGSLLIQLCILSTSLW